MNVEKISEEQQKNLVNLIKQVAQIPSPSFSEQQKAGFVKNYLKSCGYKDIESDEAGNVILKIKGNTGKYVAFVAHMDTVFQQETKLELKEDDKNIYCPSIDDNSSGVSGLLLCAKLISEYKLEPKSSIIFVFSICEEGLGNMHGSKAFVDKYKEQISEFYAVDGDFTRVYKGKIGHMRYSLETKSQGGHAFFGFGNPNAIAEMADIAKQIYDIKVPTTDGSKTTYNIGLINGGRTFNAIAENCTMSLEARSDNNTYLYKLKDKFEIIFDNAKQKGVCLNVKLEYCNPYITVENDIQKDLINRRVEVLKKYSTKLPPRVEAASLDANMAIAAGIPSTSIGVCIGHLGHSESEYLEKETLKDGLTCMLATVFSYFKQESKYGH